MALEDPTDTGDLVINELWRENNLARQRAVSTIDLEPEKAVRAIQLSQASGVDPNVIIPDIESFERDQKRRMASDLITGNPRLQAYVNSDPLAGQISNDDYGQLDTVSQSMVKLGQKGVMASTVEAFKAGFDYEGMQSEYDKLFNYVDSDVWRSFVQNGGLGGAAVTFMTALRGFRGAMFAAGTLGAEAFAPIVGANEAEKNRMRRDFIQGIEANTAGANLFRAPVAPAVKAAINEAAAMSKAAAPFIAEGKVPPTGIHPAIDQLKAEQAKIDVDNLGEALKESVKSATRDRNPDMFASFIRQHTDGEFSISAEAVMKLYGDSKIPSPDDGLLGWVPNLMGQLELAVATGGDIKVPLADFLAKADPAIFQEIKDFIRVRDEGVTIEEGKRLKEVEAARKEIEAFHGSPHEFDAFDMGKIGEGEGAQSYGHGLYFAENPKVAEEYKARVPVQDFNRKVQDYYDEYSGPDEAWASLKDNKQVFTPGQWRVLETLEKEDWLGFDYPHQALNALRQDMKLPPESRMYELSPELVQAAESMGNMYKVRIKADPETILDWDKPISAQPKVWERIVNDEILGDLKTSDIPHWPDSTGADVYHAIGEMLQSTENASILDLPNYLKALDNSNAAASNALKAAGIQGTKYYDQFSRKAAEEIGRFEKAVESLKRRLAEKDPGVYDVHIREAEARLAKAMERMAKEPQTRNYVLFDDTAVEIIERNGIAIAAKQIRDSAGLRPIDQVVKPEAMEAPKAAEVPVTRAEIEQYNKDLQARIDDLETRMTETSQAAAKAHEAGDRARSIELMDEGVRLRNERLDLPDFLPVTGAPEVRPVVKPTTTATQLEMTEPKFTVKHSPPKDKPQFGDRSWHEVELLDAEGKVQYRAQLDAEADSFAIRWIEKEGQGGSGAEAYTELARWAESQGKRLEVQPLDTAIPEKLSESALKVQGKLKAAGQVQDEGGRRFVKSEKSTTKAEQLEMPDVTRLEDREAFAKAAAIGMTKDQYARYQKLIEKQTAEDLEKLTKRAAAEAKAKLSAAYKDAANELRPEVAREVNARPHIALDNYLREGTIEGHRGDPGRIATEYLTEEQRTALGNKFYSKDGTHPDDLAALFGFDSGQAAIEALIKLVNDRRQSGLNADNYRRRLIETELERRLDERFAADRASILEEATDMVLSEIQVEMLHEQTLGLAAKAGAQFSITKEQLKAAIDEKFAESLLRNAKSDRFLADAGKAGREVVMALLKGDAAEAFRQQQRQYISIVLAREAKALEKAAGQLDRLAKRYAKADMPNVDRGAVNWIQSLLSQAGYALRVSPDDIARNIEFGDYPTLTEYVADKSAMGWEPAVTDILQVQGAKKLEAMTVQDFVEFNNAIKSLNHIGREERKIEIAGEKQDFADFKAEVKANLETLKVRPEASQGRWLYKIDSMLTKMEEIIKDLDVRKELGPLFNAIMVPMELSKAKSFDLLQELSKHFEAVKVEFGAEWRRTLKDTIPQDFLYNPYYEGGGVLFDLKRDNLIQIMLNWGNRSNIEKLTLGYASVQLGRRATKTEAMALELQIKDLIDRHATAKDWAFVQEMWKPFKGWQAQMDTVARNTSGIAPKWIDPTPVDTPFGQMEGGYWPVKYNKLTSNITVVEDKTNVKDLFGGGYFRAATSKGYLQQRTGYIDFVDISTSIEQAAGTMQQTIHDIAFRDSLIQAGKVFYDREIRALVRKHYGVEYEAQLVPWLKRIANRYSVEDQALNGLTDFMQRIRINLVGHALPLNLKVLLSPDIGVPNPAAWTRFEANRAENVKLAMEKSQEIRHMVYNMDRDFRENLERAVNKQGWTGVQQKAAEWGFKPAMIVSQEFRMSTFVDQYHKAKGRGLTDDQAATIADSYVRERHGAASIVDLPTLMSSSEGMKLMTLFYGYFNTMYNWQRQIPGQVRRGDYSGAMTAALGTMVVGSFFNATLFNRAKEDDSWFKVIGKAVIEQPLSTIPGVRDLTAYALEGHAAKSPLAGVGVAFKSLYNDAYNYYVKKKTPEKPISHVSNVIGLSTGLPLSQVGKTSQFAADVYNRKQRPKTFIEWMKGIIHGEIKPKR